MPKYSLLVVQICPKQIQDGGRPPVEKWKNQYLRNRLTDFDKIWYSDASGPSANKNSRFRKSKMAAAAILKNRQILISSQPIDRF